MEPERSGSLGAPPMRGAARRTARPTARRPGVPGPDSGRQPDTGAIGMAGLLVLAVTTAAVLYPFPAVAREAFLIAGVCGLRLVSGRRYAVLAAILIPLVSLVTPVPGWWTVVPPLAVGAAGFAWALGWLWPFGSILAGPLLFVIPFLTAAQVARTPLLAAQLQLPIPEGNFMIVQILMPALAVLALAALERFSGLRLPWPSMLRR